MSTIVTRAGKGLALSYTEMDANFTNLNTDKLEASALATYATQAALATTNTTVAGKQDALPSQTGNGGKYLGTNGTTLSWNTVDALPLQTGNAGKYLTTNGTIASWTTFSGVSLTGVETLTNKTLTTPVINTNINYSGTGGTIQVNGVDKVTIGADGISSGVAGAGLIMGTAVSTTSGTVVDFTGIPAWVKRITVMLKGVSTNGTSYPQLQIGAGSIETTGYVCTHSAISGTAVVSANLTSGCAIYSTLAASSINGKFVLETLGNNIWVITFIGNTSTTNTVISGGSKTTSSTLDRIRLTTVNGTDIFDAGSVNILYE